MEDIVENSIIRECGIDTWEPAPDGDAWTDLLEQGQVLYLPKLGFFPTEAERRFLTEDWTDGKAKNISLRGGAEPLRGAKGAPDQVAGLKALIQRFADGAATLVHGLLPGYRPHLRRGFASYRTVRAEGRETSWRKDDSRLHVDAFPSNPTGGRRLLRVFANVNPQGLPRVWKVGEPFEDHARRFLPRAPRPLPGSAWVLDKLGITKSRRSEYDHYMGQLHDLGKADLAYQAGSPQETFPFPSGTCWVVYSDQVLHAVLSGQFMLEQTFYLDVDHQRRPETSPLRVLERLAGRPLT
jgi:hypothetical protein